MVGNPTSSVRVNAVLEMLQGGFQESMPRIDIRGKDWATSPGRAEEELITENVALILSEHSVIGVDDDTKFLANHCKHEHPENHKCRTCKCGKASKSCVLMKYECRCRCEEATSAVKFVTFLSSNGTQVSSEKARAGHGQGKDYGNQRSLVFSTVRSDWMEQVWRTGDNNSESCEEYGKSECMDEPLF